MSERKRIFFLVSHLVDDNGDACSNTVPICATTSVKVAEKMIRVHLEYRNTHTTLAWDEEIRRVLPGVLPDPSVLSPEIEEALKGEDERAVEVGQSLLDEILNS